MAAVAGAGVLSEQRLTAAHQTLRDTRGIQFDFTALPREEPPAWLVSVLEAIVAGLRAAAPVLQYVFWAGLALLVLAIVYVMLRETLGDRLPWMRRRQAPPAGADWRPEAGAARALLEDADRLAEAGRYEEAIHLLLFRSIEDLSRRKPGLVKPALTSRDIAALSAIPERPRGAFARIAAAVEMSFFGGRPVSPADFHEARRHYEAFAFAEAWR